MLSVGITLSVIAPFFDTPSLKKKGKLVYYSPLFLAEKEKNGVITIHGATLFDYVYVIDRQLSGKQRTTFVIQSYLEGVLALINEYEALGTYSIKIKGTSYILSKSTAKKLGFTEVKTDFVQKVILIYNYVNLALSHSIAKAKLSLPNFGNVRTFEAELSTLVDKKQYMLQLKEKLKNNTANNTCSA
ncbi:hypothetical protein [Pontibacter sp. H249]|uniref:hypothetical protein n=1 Tax=Pontibacter sp. H249 TaxID=3133420 RepID=UPI0030C1177F